MTACLRLQRRPGRSRGRRLSTARNSHRRHRHHPRESAADQMWIARRTVTQHHCPAQRGRRRLRLPASILQHQIPKRCRPFSGRLSVSSRPGCSGAKMKDSRSRWTISTTSSTRCPTSATLTFRVVPPAAVPRASVDPELLSARCPRFPPRHCSAHIQQQARTTITNDTRPVS